MSFERNILVCLYGCKSRRRFGHEVLCNFSGRSCREHADSGQCGDPAGSRFKTVMIASGRAVIVAENGADSPCVLAGKRRIELLKAVCESCPEKVSITVSGNPLRGDVLCKAAPSCCGGGPGTIDLLYGACVELKHEAALEAFEKEQAGKAVD